MNTGMLWLQVDMKKPLRERIAEAVDYYREKYGRQADVVFASPRILAGHDVVVEGIQVKPMRLPISLLWLGVEDAARGIERRSVELIEEMEMRL